MKHSARGQANTLILQADLAEHGILRNNDKVLAYTLLLDKFEIFHQLDCVKALGIAAAVHQLNKMLSEHYAAAPIEQYFEKPVMLIK